MNLRGVLFLLGRLLLALGAALLVPAGVALLTRDGGLWPFLYAAGFTGVIGVALERSFRQQRDFSFGRREAFLLVTAAWITASLVGALPYIFIKGPGFIVNGLFESASGFTTTGASILSDIEGQPASLLLWRSLTQWLGGMGIIVLGIAILPKLAIGGMELLGAEAPGPIQEKLTPRIAQTAKALWGIYALLTVVQVGALAVCGLSPLDAVNHAFTTMSTGGFSTQNTSVGQYGSAAVEVVILLFMVLAGANFALHYRLLRGRPGPLLRDPEFRLYGAILGGAAVLLTTKLIVSGQADGFFEALRLGTFQSATIVTTTGYATADFDAWPHFSRGLLFLLMFVGGCTGSTGGSVKVVRAMILLKKLAIDLRKLIRPHAVLPLRIGARALPEDVVTSVTTFMLLFLGLFGAGGLLLAFMGLDLVSAFSASAACLGNIGPGFGEVGPMQNYAALAAPAKLMLTALMLIGRLELYTVLVLIFLFRRR
jgi:trk system potassium uptake protein TrkH